MNKNQYNTRVVVAGAGPAGSVCAYLLLKAGVDVVLLDKAQFPRDKICGGGLTHKAYKLLSEIYPDFQYDYNGVRHIKGRHFNKWHCVRRSNAEGVVIALKSVVASVILANCFQPFVVWYKLFVPLGTISSAV